MRRDPRLLAALVFVVTTLPAYFKLLDLMVWRLGRMSGDCSVALAGSYPCFPSALEAGLSWIAPGLSTVAAALIAWALLRPR